MPPAYKPVPVSGTEETTFVSATYSRRTARKGEMFFEEIRELTLADGEVVRRASNLPALVFKPSNLDKVLPLYDPQTGDPKGSSMTYGDLVTLVYSAYRLAAANRDNNSPDA